MTNRPGGVLYVGVTGNLVRRIAEHRNGVMPGFTSRYRLKRLVLAERHPTIGHAIQREKNIKKWPRQWKVELIEAANPKWRDLWEEMQW